MANLTISAIEKNGGNYPTLKAISIAMDVPYVRLHSVSKQPQEGQIYDRNAFNWDAIDRFIVRRLDPDKGFATVDELVIKALEIDSELKTQDGRKTATAGVKVITLEDGTQIPARKVEYALGDKVQIKKDETKKIYTIVFATISNLVLKLDTSELLVCMSNNTANWRLMPAAKPVEPVV